MQESNISYPTLVNLLLKVAILTKTAAKALNQHCHAGQLIYHVNISRLKQIALFSSQTGKITSRIIEIGAIIRNR